jgi:uncharacterized repeat protein (TIGR01451 family)
VVTPTATGSLTNTVTAASAVADSNSLNNVAVSAVTAVTDSADLQVTLAGAPNPVTVGGNLTYTIALTNKGPSTATGVVVTNPLPSSVTLVSFATPQGTAANVSGAVVFTLGSVPTGTNVTMQVVVTANVAGVVNSTVLASASGTFDPVAGNNSATLAVAVQSPAADIDLGASSLLAESITPSNGAIDPGEQRGDCYGQLGGDVVAHRRGEHKQPANPDLRCDRFRCPCGKELHLQGQWQSG